MIDLATTSRICEHLEKYVYDRIWNEPYTENRFYTIPGLLTPSPVSGFFSGRYSKVLLPPFNSEEDLDTWLPRSAAKFFVYAIPDRFFSAAKLNVSKWTLLSDYCTERCTDLHVFTANGIILNRGAIYIRQADMNDCILMAVDAHMFLATVGTWDLANTVRFGNYIDSDGVADNKVIATQVTTRQYRDRNRFEVKYPWEGQSYLLYNGKLVEDEKKYRPYIAVNDWIEAVYDEDIIGVFNVPLDDSSIPSYIDTSDVEHQKEWVIVHIPKEINPKHYLITPNTCDIWLVPETTTVGNAAMAGRYLYPAGREQYYRQLTHNDFAIDLAAIREYAGKADIGFTSCHLRVYVRTHNKKSPVVRDANYIDMLYNLTDGEIIQLLRKQHPWQQATADTTTTYVDGVRTYWYPDDNSITGWSRIDNIDSEEAFNKEKPAGVSTFYLNPTNSLLFWAADYLEHEPYANALIRRREAKYQDKATQCSLCGNVKCDAKVRGKYVTDRICQNFIRTPNNQCEVCRMKDSCTTYNSGVLPGNMCPSYSVRNIEDYVRILGYFHVLSLVGKRIWHFKVTKEGTRDFVVQAPLALSASDMGADDFICVVYHNGYRVDQSRVTVSKTNRDNNGIKEFEHTASGLSRSTLVIQTVYATRLKVSVTPIYKQTSTDTVLLGRAYYKEVDGVKVPAKVVTDVEFVELSPEERGTVDYLASTESDPVFVNTDPDNEYFQVNTEEEPYFKNLVNYYVKDEVTHEYRFLVPETDYNVGEPIGNRFDVVYRYIPKLYEIVPEFKQDDEIAVEVFDCRHNGGITWFKRPDADSTYIIPTKTVDQWRIFKPTSFNDPVAGNGLNRFEDKTANIDASYFDPINKQLTIPTSFGTDVYLLVEGPNAFLDSYDKEMKDTTFGIIGHENKTEVIQPTIPGDGVPTKTYGKFPLESEVIFINNRRLIEGLDYTSPKYGNGGTENIRITSLPYIQNLSYLWDGTHETKTVPQSHANIDILRTDTTTLGSQYGFMIGKTVTWMGQAPFWFNELSTLIVDGAVCSRFTHTMGSITVEHDDHRNGSPYEIRTACSKRVMDIVGCADLKEEDERKIKIIRDFFESAPIIPLMQTIIPHSHKLYSIYLEKIVSLYLTTTGSNSFDFVMTDGETREEFETRLLNGNSDYKTLLNKIKEKDLVYKLTPYDLGFVDVYPLYHRAVTKYRDDYVKLMYLNSMLSPVDNVKHKDAINERI